MKIKVRKDQFLKALDLAKDISEAKTNIPVLACVRMEAKKDSLELKATNLEVSFVCRVPAKVQKKGVSLISVKKLFYIIKEFSEGEIFLERKEKELEISQGKAVFHLVEQDEKSFPTFPSYEENKFFSFNQEMLSDMIQKTLYSVSNDESRYHLNGVYFETEKSKSLYKMVSTDGHRLSFIERKSEDKFPNIKEGIIIPKKGINEIKKLAEIKEGSFEISIEGPQFILKKKTKDVEYVLMIRLIEGQYPDYRRLIPKKLERSLVIDREIFQNTLKRVSLLSDEKSKGVSLKIKPGMMELTSQNETGDAKEEMSIDYKGKELQIGFNSRYILDVLSSFGENDKKIHFEIKDNMSPGLVQSEKDLDYKCVVMPMRI